MKAAELEGDNDAALGEELRASGIIKDRGAQRGAAGRFLEPMAVRADRMHGAAARRGVSAC